MRPHRLLLAYLIISAAACHPRPPINETMPSDVCGNAQLASTDNVISGNQAPVPCLKNLYRSVQERPLQRGDIAVAVAVSGGGHRASNYAAGVLMALESFNYQGQSNILREIDYFSTVSGGGLAVGAYLSSLHDYVSTAPIAGSQDYSLVREWPNLSGLMIKNLQRSLYRAALQPGLGRAGHLERRLDAVILGADRRGRSLILGDIFRPNCEREDIEATRINGVECTKSDSNRKVLLPYWFANATVMTNGAIFTFTPEILSAYSIQNYSHNVRDETLRDRNPYELPLSVGMSASASFPVAIPATTLISDLGKSKAPQELVAVHLLDGGMSDNLAVLTALHALEQDPARCKVLLVIDSYIGSYSPFSDRPTPPSALKVVKRLTESHLDSWRGRHREIVEGLARNLGLQKDHIVFLSFDELLDPPDDQTDAERFRDFEVQEAERRKLYSQARLIPTNLALSSDEQELLITLGQIVVSTKLLKLRTAFECDQTQN